MNQVSFLTFALRAHQSSPGGVNPNPVGGPSGAGGPSVCTSKKTRRKPRPVDQLPLPLLGLHSSLAHRLPLEYSSGVYVALFCTRSRQFGRVVLSRGYAA